MMMLDTMPVTDVLPVHTAMAGEPFKWSERVSASADVRMMVTHPQAQSVLEANACNLSGGLFSTIKAMAASSCDAPLARDESGAVDVGPARTAFPVAGRVPDVARAPKIAEKQIVGNGHPRRVIAAAMIASLLLLRIRRS